LVLGEDVPYGFGELASDVDARDLRASLAAEPVLGPLVAIPLGSIGVSTVSTARSGAD
jgi:hypothetical protein